jgi:hypothetical protein
MERASGRWNENFCRLPFSLHPVQKSTALLRSDYSRGIQAGDPVRSLFAVKKLSILRFPFFANSNANKPMILGTLRRILRPPKGLAREMKGY